MYERDYFQLYSQLFSHSNVILQTEKAFSDRHKHQDSGYGGYNKSNHNSNQIIIEEEQHKKHVVE